MQVFFVSQTKSHPVIKINHAFQHIVRSVDHIFTYYILIIKFTVRLSKVYNQIFAKKKDLDRGVL